MTSARRPYVRPMAGWWKRDPFFVRYMWREVTALGVAVYAVVLMFGLLRLAQGPEAFGGWLDAMRSVPSIVLHVLLLLSMVFHAHSWFEIMPKTMPLLFAGGHRVSEGTITRTGLAAAVLAAVALFAVAWMLKP